MIKAVIFDLDDTLYRETVYVKSGFCAIAREFGDASMAEKLYSLFLKDNKNVYQRAGLTEDECLRCIDIYRNHYPNIHLSDDYKSLLEKLRKDGYKLGIITDGDAERQKRKIDALGLWDLVDNVIVTDELGGIEYRKPNPAAFEKMRDFFGIEFDEMMYVGDNPEKDFYIGNVYPIKTVRLMPHKEGIYSDKMYKGGIKENIRVENLTDLAEVLKLPIRLDEGI